MSQEALRVLVTGGGTATALSVLKGLARAPEVPTWTCLADPSPDIAGRQLADAYLAIPRADAPGFVEALLEAAQELAVELLIPIFDLELVALAEARLRFEAAGIQVALSDREAVEVCRDKVASMDRLAALGLPVPRRYSPAEARGLGPEAFPLFVKPRFGRGSEGARRVAELADLERALVADPELVIQEDASQGRPEEFSVDVHCTLAGRFVACCPRRRDEVRAGQSYKGSTFRDPELEAGVRAAVEGLGLRGPSLLQGFRGPAGYQFIEVNPRSGAATCLAMAAGLNSPALLVRELRGLPLGPVEPRPGVRMLRYWEEVFLEGEEPLSLGSGLGCP